MAGRGVGELGARAEYFERWQAYYSTTSTPLDVVANDACLDCRGTCSDTHTPGSGLRGGSLGSLPTSAITAGSVDVHRTRRGIRRADPGEVKIALQVRGHTLLVQHEREALLTAGDFALYDTSEPFSMRFDRHFTLFYLSVPRDRLKLPSALAYLTAVPIRARGGAGSLVSPLLARLWQEMSTAAPPTTPIFEDAVLDLICAALSAEASPAAPGAAILAGAKSFIDTHLSDPGLDTSMVAGAQHISVRYLQKLFNEDRLTVAGWIRAHRLERCRRDLRDPMRARESIGEICARHGLIDSAHFSQMFKRAYGLSPRAFRAQAQSVSPARSRAEQTVDMTRSQAYF
jgi:AraC-like DNA-binding protein